MIIGICIWFPLWIFSYTDLAKTMLNNPNNIIIAITTVVVMIIGIILMFIGMVKRVGK